MRKISVLILVLAVAPFLLPSSGSVAQSGTTSFMAVLNTAQEVPTPTVTGNPSGTASVVFDGTNVNFYLTVTDLSGPIAAAHFHNAPAGTAGGVVHTIPFFNGNSTFGTWTPSDAEPLTPELVAALLAGNLYVNIHTAQNPAGEIRGQVTAN
ncbi:MAG: CHRD domain-containing protein [Deinococcus sp.]|nr:CHRD domain-containing protein [Deinococcus sp.]